MRETITIKTPREGHEVVLNKFITGRERRTIDAITLSMVKVSFADNKATPNDFDPALIGATEDKILEVVVVSVDGKTEKIVDAVLDMHSTDSKYVAEKASEIADDKDFEEKKNQLKSNTVT